MKKVVLSLAVLFSVAMVSCGGKKAAEAVDSESIAVAEVVEEVVVDTNAVDSTVDTTVVVAAEAVEAPAN